MLAVRYVENGEEKMIDLSKSQYEQITDEDIFEMFGKHGVSLEMRKHINIFESEDEFVDCMSHSLEEGESEIYMQGSWDEFDGDSSNDAYVVFKADDIAQLLQEPESYCYKAIYRVAKVLVSNISEFVEEFSVISCTHILYMICVALVYKEKYVEYNIYEIILSMNNLIDRYYGNDDRLPDRLPSEWKEVLIGGVEL